MHAHYFLACLGPYFSQINSEQRDQSIYRIKRTWRTCLSTKFDLTTQVCMYARDVLVCTGPYLSQFRSDLKDRDIYGIRGTCRSWLWCLCMCTQACTHASMHAHYFLACLGPYLGQIGSDQRYQGIYTIRRSCWTSLSKYFTLSMWASVHAPYVLVCTDPYLSQSGLDQRD